MKKNILICGLISGLIIASVMLISIVMCYKNPDFEGSMLLGYASQILAFSVVFVGIKNERDKLNGGIISFGKAFKTGLLISLIASSIYVGVWLIDYYVFIPDFMDKYSEHQIKALNESSISATEMSAQLKKINSMKELYKYPAFVILITYMEVLPLGLVISLVAALILKRKTKPRTVKE